MHFYLYQLLDFIVIKKIKIYKLLINIKTRLHKYLDFFNNVLQKFALKYIFQQNRISIADTYNRF